MQKTLVRAAIAAALVLTLTPAVATAPVASARSSTASEQVAVVNILSDAATTGLRVRIQRRSDGNVAWEGLAQGPAPGASYAERAALFDRLARALFQDFPGESGRTIRVR